MKGDEEEVSRRRDEEVCKISVDDTYEGVSLNHEGLSLTYGGESLTYDTYDTS